MLDVRDRDFALRGVERVADRELVERLAERMHARIALRRRRASSVQSTARERVGRALHGGALHVVQHAADAAHLLAAAGAAGTAVHQMRQRRAVPGRFLRAVRFTTSTRP